MLYNYILIAYRNFIRQVPLGVINILGLSIGIACSLIIILFVYRELSYDKHFRDGDRIFRVTTSFFNIGTFANGPQHLNERLLQYPEVESITRIDFDGELPIESETLKQDENNVYEVDSTFFGIFDFPFIAGNPTTCLQDPASIVITDRIALKYFATTDAIGKTLLTGKDKIPRVVTGVVEKTENPSHLLAEIWIPYEPNTQKDINWNSADVYNYVKLKSGFGQLDLERQIQHLIKNEVYPIYGRTLPYDEWVKTPNAYKLFVQPLPTIYLQSKFRKELSAGGNENNIYIFSGVASLVLFLAMVNFINLSTARAGKRAKEVGLRKALGTSRSSLITQFLVESVLTCVIALMISLVLAEIFLKGYQIIIGQKLLSSIFVSWNALIGAILFTCLLGVLAGVYPALYLTSFQPVKVLKGNFLSNDKSRLRNMLVIFQFTISVSLTVFIITIANQLTYLQNKDLGFNQDNVFVINNVSHLDNNKTAYRNRLDQLPQVTSSCFTSNPPAGNSFWIFTYKTNKMSESVTFNTIPGDERLLETFGIKLLEGRNFNPQSDTGFTAAILNETAVKELMLEDPIGTEINEGQKVIGVVSDFHFKALQDKIEPLVIVFKGDGSSLAFKLSGNVSDFIHNAEKTWKQFSPDEPIKYSFVDENFSRLLEKELLFSKIMTTFAVLAICISCLGLFGLSLFATGQRIKEIGIRKVLGASARSILLLLSKGFFRLILIALVIAIPITIYFIDIWLSKFAYHVPVSWETFVITSIIMILLSGFTVAGSSFKAAMRNPVESIKCE